MTEYKDKFTLDGRLKPTLGVTAKKVEAADRLLGAALRGDKIADGQFREALTTSDLQFNVAHLVTTQFLPQFDEADRSNWNTIAGVREVPDFSPVRLQSILAGNWAAHLPGELWDGEEEKNWSVLPVKARIRLTGSFWGIGASVTPGSPRPRGCTTPSRACTPRAPAPWSAPSARRRRRENR